MNDSLYTRLGDTFSPTGLGVSIWNPDAQMGVALAGLAAHVLESIPAPAPMSPARMTIDILGAVPMEPLVPSVRMVREGKRMQVVEVELSHGGRTWVKASALRVREASSPMCESPPSYAFPDLSTVAASTRESAFATTIRLHGGFPDPGPGAWWVNPKIAVVAGHSLSAMEAVAMISDYGSGVAPLVSSADWTYANVDVSIHLTRAPRGQWLLIDAQSESAGNGIGLVHSRLGDQAGMIGMAHQTVFLDRR